MQDGCIKRLQVLTKRIADTHFGWVLYYSYVYIEFEGDPDGKQTQGKYYPVHIAAGPEEDRLSYEAHEHVVNQAWKGQLK